MWSLLRVSQTWQVASSYAAKRYRPLIENAREVTPFNNESELYLFNSLSARISNKRQEKSSDPVPNADPLGKNLYLFLFVNKIKKNKE